MKYLKKYIIFKENLASPMVKTKSTSKPLMKADAEEVVDIFQQIAKEKKFNYKKYFPKV